MSSGPAGPADAGRAPGHQTQLCKVAGRSGPGTEGAPHSLSQVSFFRLPLPVTSFFLQDLMIDALNQSLSQLLVLAVITLPLGIWGCSRPGQAVPPGLALPGPRVAGCNFVG